jgi:hypothetical protein
MASEAWTDFVTEKAEQRPPPLVLSISVGPDGQVNFRR